jgi:hypothetical protein
VFWLLAVWLVFVGLASLIPQIFELGSRTTSGAESCAKDLNDLTDELLNHTGDWLKSQRRQELHDTLEAFFSDFDRRLMQIKSSCTESESAAFDELSRLRQGVFGMLERFAREELPRLHKLDALVDRQSAPTR